MSEQLTAEKVAISTCSYFTPMSEQLTAGSYMVAMFLFGEQLTACRKVTWLPCSYFT
jgi:hypothetical protein